MCLSLLKTQQALQVSICYLIIITFYLKKALKKIIILDVGY